MDVGGVITCLVARSFARPLVFSHFYTVSLAPSLLFDESTGSPMSTCGLDWESQ
jgi:hypothetical protein